MKVFLIVFGIVVAYIFIGVLYYWTSILICYKKSKTKKSLNYWLNDYEGSFITNEQNYFWLSVFWIITLPFYIVIILFYFISFIFSNIIKKILKINERINDNIQ